MNHTPILTTELRLSPSELYVSDLPAMTRYYCDIVGLSVIESSTRSVTLGNRHTSVIRLAAKPNLAFAPPRSAGLFHNAIVFDSKGDLARAAGNTLLQRPQSFVGTGDHLVSEAFYFNDPENNGLELYFDRPQDTWQWQNGRVKMDTLYIDPTDYINRYASGLTGNQIKLGHVHLKVGDIADARKFYVNILGFAITATAPGVMFVSIGGYHHHLALNTWLSEGTGVRQQTLGLSEISISLNAAEDINQLAVRLESYGRAFLLTGKILRVGDPWGNVLLFSAS